MTAQREWMDKDYYKVLGVPKDATSKDIKSEYRKLSRKYHPDANQGDEKAEERFKEISAAYDVVGDEEKRKEYDQVRSLGPMGGGFGGGQGPGSGGLNFDPSGFGDLGDLLGGMFGRGGGPTQRQPPGFGRGQQPSPARKGADLEAVLHLSFDDAVRGITTAVHLVSDAACSTCKGSGSEPGTSPGVCGICHGNGVTDDDQGGFSFSRPCGGCSGRGTVITDPCSSCRGTGSERRPREVKVRIPAGVKNGQRIKLAKRGEPGTYGGPPGDLFVIVDVAGHEHFGRKGNHLTLVVPVTFAEAALGAKITVPTLDDGTRTIKIPAGTGSGQKFRVKGQGVKTAKTTGDLLVEVLVDVPSELTDKQRNAIEALQKATTNSPRAYLEVD